MLGGVLTIFSSFGLCLEEKFDLFACWSLRVQDVVV